MDVPATPLEEAIERCDTREILRLLDSGCVLTARALTRAMDLYMKFHPDSALVYELIWRGCPHDSETLTCAITNGLLGEAYELVSFGHCASNGAFISACIRRCYELARELALHLNDFTSWELASGDFRSCSNQIQSMNETQVFEFIRWAIYCDNYEIVEALFDTSYVPSYDVLKLITISGSKHFIVDVLRCARSIKTHLKRLIDECESKRDVLLQIKESWKTPPLNFHDAVMSDRLDESRSLISDGSANEQTYQRAIMRGFIETAKQIICMGYEMTDHTIVSTIESRYVEFIPLLLAAGCPKSSRAVELAIEHMMPKLATELIYDGFELTSVALERAIYNRFPKLALEMHARGCPVSEKVASCVTEWNFEGMLKAGCKLRQLVN